MTRCLACGATSDVLTDGQPCHWCHALVQEIPKPPRSAFWRVLMALPTKAAMTKTAPTKRGKDKKPAGKSAFEEIPAAE